MTNLYQGPLLAINIEAVKVIDIIVVATPKDVKLVFIDSRSMAPSRARDLAKIATTS